jgi:hypothetical protein
MNVYPGMDIRFPADKESLLAEDMKQRATGLWKWHGKSPVSRPVEDGQYFFHRDGDESIPACILCIGRREPGHLVVQNIVPDSMRAEISIEQYVQMLQEFDTIASPAAEALDGMTSIDTSKRSLEDYFSKESIEKLKYFCETSNAGDLGTHLLDQRKWMAFLLHYYRNKREKELVHCDTFGKLLQAKGWWPESGIKRLVHEYDFAMRLLEQADNPEA